MEIRKIAAASTGREGACRGQGADGNPVVLANTLLRLVLAISLLVTI